jgi:hypothetical protein
MHAGIQRVNRQYFSQFRHSGGRFSVDPFVEVTVAIRDPELPQAVSAHDSEHRETVFPMPHEPPDLTRPEGSASAQNEHALEQTRLAGAIRAEDVVPAGV